MVLLNLRVLLSSKNRIEGLNILRTVVGSLRGEPGFVRFNLYQDLDNEKAITFEEVWNGQDDLDRRVRSESYRHILVLMDLSLVPSLAWALPMQANYQQSMINGKVLSFNPFKKNTVKSMSWSMMQYAYANVKATSGLRDISEEIADIDPVEV